MKEAGINRAFIGNIGLESVPYGDVKMLSDEWWEILHLALKTATELDIEIGIFNSPRLESVRRPMGKTRKCHALPGRLRNPGSGSGNSRKTGKTG